MDLHHEAVIKTHPRHLGQDLTTKRFRFHRGDGTGQRGVEQTLALGGRTIAGLRSGMPVVGRRGAHRLEERTTCTMRREIARPGRRILAGHRTELRDVGGESVELRVGHRVGSIRGDHAAFPTGGANFLVMDQRIKWGLRRCDHLDVESLEQRARPKRRLREAGVDPIEVAVGGFRRQQFVDAENGVERMIEPQPRGGATKQVIVRRKRTPDLARVLFQRPAIGSRNAQILKPHTVTVEHAKHVMVGRNKKCTRVGKRGVIGKPLWVRVPMRTHDRQALHRRVEAARDGACGWISGKQAVGVEIHRDRHGAALQRGNDG